MKISDLNILLADDDDDDCMFFKSALEELSLPVSLNRVANGVELMNFLENNSLVLPHLLFLDLNMPCKSGFECLAEIKKHERLRDLPVVIYSTSSNPDVIEILYNQGACHYIQKPADFTNLKSVINKAITLSVQSTVLQPAIEKFLIQP